MNRGRATLIGFVVVMLFTSGCSVARRVEQDIPPITTAEAAKRLATTRMPFTANRGQAAEEVAFYAPILDGAVFVTTKGRLVYSLPAAARPVRTVTLAEELLDGVVREVTGKNESHTRVSVLRGNDPAKWRRNLPAYDAVSLGEVYEGVEVELQVSGRTVEKLFHVGPGAEPSRIRIKLTGARSVAITEHGELEVTTARGSVRFSRPVAYQEAAGRQERVEVAYALEGDTYGFRLGAYDRSKPLVIDPLLTATLLGGFGSEDARALVLDSAGNVYVAGSTESPDFPGISADSADSFKDFTPDAFVAKLSPDLSVVLAATFLGGNWSDAATALAVDAEGNVYVAGWTDATDFPGLRPESAQDTLRGSGDAFVAKLDAGLSEILAATLLGGTEYERAHALALDGAGHVYVAGGTRSPDFPGVSARAGSPDSTYAGFGEAFVAKLDAELTTILAATFLGGSGTDEANAIALNGAGQVYVAGQTSSPDFPGVGSRAGSADFTFADTEAFVAKLDGNLGSILAATFLGGSAFDSAAAIALDGAGHVYVSGETDSADFPGIGPASADSTLAPGLLGSAEAFVVKLNADLGTILAATFLGGSDSDEAAALALDGSGNVYVAGWTASFDFPGAGVGSVDPTRVVTDDFVAKLNADLTGVKAATFLGGSGFDYATGIALSSTGTIDVVGGAKPTFPGLLDGADFPGVGPLSADSSFVGYGEAFVARLDALLVPGFELLQELKNYIDSCVPCPPTVKQALLRHVNQAMTQVAAGNTRGAVSTLNLFVRDTEQFMRSRQLPAEIGRELIRRAQQILAQLGA